MGRRRSASDGSRPEMQKQHLSLTCLVDIWQNDCFCSAQSEVVNEKKCLLGLQIAEDRLAMRSAPFNAEGDIDTKGVAAASIAAGFITRLNLANGGVSESL